jgi:hypothetical protein
VPLSYLQTLSFLHYYSKRQIMQRVIICVSKVLVPYPLKYSGYYRHQMFHHSQVLIYSYVVISIYVKLKHRKIHYSWSSKKLQLYISAITQHYQTIRKRQNIKRLIQGVPRGMWHTTEQRSLGSSTSISPDNGETYWKEGELLHRVFPGECGILRNNVP